MHNYPEQLNVSYLFADALGGELTVLFGNQRTTTLGRMAYDAFANGQIVDTVDTHGDDTVGLALPYPGVRNLVTTAICNVDRATRRPTLTGIILAEDGDTLELANKVDPNGQLPGREFLEVTSKALNMNAYADLNPVAGQNQLYMQGAARRLVTGASQAFLDNPDVVRRSIQTGYSNR